MTPSLFAVVAGYPDHRMRKRGLSKCHLIPVDERDNAHRCHSLCDCRPLPVGWQGPYGEGLWLHRPTSNPRT